MKLGVQTYFNPTRRYMVSTTKIGMETYLYLNGRYMKEIKHPPPPSPCLVLLKTLKVKKQLNFGLQAKYLNVLQPIYS